MDAMRHCEGRKPGLVQLSKASDHHSLSQALAESF